MNPALKHMKFSEIELEEVNPKLSRQLITGEQVMLARVILKAGCVVPEHSHVNEQLSHILEGELQFTIDGKQIVVKAGEVLCIPPNLPHSAFAPVDVVGIDVFVPPREDWLSKTDDYLRHANQG